MCLFGAAQNESFKSDETTEKDGGTEASSAGSELRMLTSPQLLRLRGGEPEEDGFEEVAETTASGWDGGGTCGGT